MEYLDEAKMNFLNKEKYLSEYATKSSDAIRLIKREEDMRPPYFRDIDRIIYSLSYTRYMDKTQVYVRSNNDHISKRITHVQLVSKIARTIGRALNLNEDLIEAIALGHDIGHTPLGHEGESILNEISLRELNEYFAHNIQSVRHLMCVEKNGQGLNLCVQVLDGIMCHNGEILSCKYTPVEKTKEEFLEQYENAYHNLEESKKVHPMTLEGCVVRISDIIGYIGRDIDDAVMIGKIKREDVPTEITDVLGCTNKEIVNTIILDIVKNSLDKPYIEMSQEVYEALFKLKEFNYINIYKPSLTAEERAYYRDGMNRLYEKYIRDIEENNTDSDIYTMFLNDQVDEYMEKTKTKRKVIDYLAGMTDELFLTAIDE